MPPNTNSRRSNITRTTRTICKSPRSAARIPDISSIKLTPKRQFRDHSAHVNNIKPTRWSSTNGQAISEAQSILISSDSPLIRSIRSEAASSESEVAFANQPLPLGYSFLIEATSIHNNEPILISRKIDSFDISKPVHDMNVISLEIFDTNKKNFALKKTLIQTDTLSVEYNADCAPSDSLLEIIHYTSILTQRRESEGLNAQLLSDLKHSIVNTATLPPSQSRRVYMHYSDNEVSPEEKMAKMKRYAYTHPESGTKLQRQKEEFELKLKRKRAVRVELEDDRGEKTVKRI